MEFIGDINGLCEIGTDHEIGHGVIPISFGFLLDFHGPVNPGDFGCIALASHMGEPPARRHIIVHNISFRIETVGEAGFRRIYVWVLCQQCKSTRKNQE